MTERYLGKYRSASIRKPDWDYGSPGYYYVIICTKDRQPFLGEVILWTGPIENDQYMICEPPWEGMCGGIAGTHQYASLPDVTVTHIDPWIREPSDSKVRPQPHTPTPALPDVRIPNGTGTHIDVHPYRDSTFGQASVAPYIQPSPRSKPHAGDEPVPVVRLTQIGCIAYQNWIHIPNHYPFVVLDEFVIMPDHMHGILYLKKPGYRARNKNAFGPQSQNLGSIIRGFKGATKAYATSHNLYFAWQARFHDDVITSQTELEKIRQHIKNNPARWIERNQPTTP